MNDSQNTYQLTEIFLLLFCQIDRKQLRIQTSSRRHTFIIQSQSFQRLTVHTTDKPKRKRASLFLQYSQKEHSTRRNTQREIVDRNQKTIQFKTHTLSIRLNIRQNSTIR